MKNNHCLDENNIKVLHCERKRKELILLKSLKKRNFGKNIWPIRKKTPRTNTPLILPKFEVSLQNPGERFLQLNFTTPIKQET